jgi:hypothetical protein
MGRMARTAVLTKTFAAANGGLSASGVIVFLLAAVIFSVLITWAFNQPQAAC